MNTKQLTLTGLMAAVLCIMGPLSLPVPISPVPVSMGTFAVYLTVYILGMKKGLISILIYLLLGLAGLPVFTGFSGGPAKVFGPTGGYLVGYLFMGMLIGFVTDRWRRDYMAIFLGMLAGTAVLYLFGTIWLAQQAGMSFGTALAAGVLPFIPGDMVKILLAILTGEQVRRRLWRAGLLQKKET